MTRSHENRCFRRFRQTRDPRLLAKVFDATAPELLRVAGHLANGDPELAKDALQATFLTAIEDRDRYDPARGDVRPWLLGILANHVRKERRRLRRHLPMQGAGDGAATGADPAAAAEHSEFAASTRDALGRLDAPFREVLVLHLQHGLTATEIADALGRPAGTVRTQIVRGLDKLRALLPAGFTAVALGMVLTPGPVLAAVRRNVLSSLPHGAAAIGSSSFLLSSWRSIAMAMTMLALVLSPWLSSWLYPPPPTIAPPDGSTKSAFSRGTEPEPTADRVLVARSGTAVADAADLEVPQAPPTQQIEVAVTYERDGTPAVDVPVQIRVSGHLRQWQTDAEGKVRTSLPWPGVYEAYVAGTNAYAMMSWQTFERRKAVQRVSMTIPPGAELSVRVVDHRGAPVAGAVVEAAHGRTVGQRLNMLGKTDADGRLQRRDIAALDGDIRAWAPGHTPSGLRRLRTEVGRPAEVELRLPSNGLVARGRVVDESGEPLAGADLALVQLRRIPLEPRFSQSGPDGTFVFDTLHAGIAAVTGRHEDGTLRRGEVRFEHDGTNEPFVELRLTRGAQVHGVLTGADGTRLAGTNLVARPRPAALHGLSFLETWTTSARDGSFVLDALVPGTYALESDLVDTLVVTLRDGERREWNPMRKASARCSFRVVDAQGQPLAGWNAVLFEPGVDWPSRGCVLGDDGRRLRTDVIDWEFPAGSYYRIGVYKKLGKHEVAWRDFAKLPNLITPPLIVGLDHEIRVPAHAATMHVLSGELVDAELTPIRDARVILTGVLGSVFPLEAEVDGAGAFRFEDLPPGRYKARVVRADKPPFALPDRTVRDVEAHSFGRVVVPETGVVVVEQLPNGVDPDRLRMRLEHANGDSTALRRGEDGIWRSPQVYRDRYRLTGGDTRHLLQSIDVDVQAATVRVEPRFRPHRATRVTVVLDAGHRRDMSRWSGTLRTRQGGRTTSEHRLSRDFSGTFPTSMTFELLLPAGPQQLDVRGVYDRTGLVEFVVPEDGGGEVTVHLAP